MSTNPSSRSSLLRLYKQLLRACQTFPSKNRTSIYQAIRQEWREHKDQQDKARLEKQISVAYKGLEQLRQYDERSMTGGKVGSPNWSVTLEQNPMPKPPDYDERKKNRK